MPLLKDIDPTSLGPPSILIYGSPRTGKTLWAMTAGKGTEIIDLDPGVRSALNFKDEFHLTRLECEITTIVEPPPGLSDNVPQPPVAFQQALRYLFKISDQCQKKTYKPRLLVVDSFSALADYALRFTRATSGIATSGKQQDGRMIYGLAMEQLSNFLAVFRSLPIAKILIAHSQRDEVDVDSSGTNKRSITEIGVYGRKFPGEIPKYFDEVLFSQIRELGGGKTSWEFQTVSTSVVVAGSRSNLPNPYSMKEGLPDLLKRLNYSM
jgi:hypothetical protein